MKRLLLAAGALSCLAVEPARADALGEAVLDEINFARTRPAAYAEELRAAAARWRRDVRFRYEDPEALDEAIAFLERQPPLPPLASEGRLQAAAGAHVAGQGPSGQVGHGGASSFAQRLRSKGVFAGMSAENISYGYGHPQDVVRQLIVDSGVPNRGHRANIFSRGFQYAGAACGEHRTYGVMCVIDFAGGLATR